MYSFNNHSNQPTNPDIQLANNGRLASQPAIKIKPLAARGWLAASQASQLALIIKILLRNPDTRYTQFTRQCTVYYSIYIALILQQSKQSQQIGFQRVCVHAMCMSASIAI